MNNFEIRSYTKKDLALRYFPSATPHTAVNRLMSWICRCQPLTAALAKQGYRKTSKWFSAREVRLIVEYLGGPWSIGSSDHRNLNGIYTDVFLGSLKARNLLWKSFLKYGLWPEINHRIVFVKPWAESNFPIKWAKNQARLKFSDREESQRS